MTGVAGLLRSAGAWLVVALWLATATPVCAEPPASIAVAFDTHRIRPVLADGLADRATGRRVTADDPVRVASVSKLVTALGVLRLVDAHRLDLDRDVSDWLGWNLRHPAFPDVPITLRMLLSHRAGLTDGADYAFPLGDTLRAHLADPRAWDGARRPASDRFAYANIDLVVVGSVMEAATGERFDRLMRRLVLAPLGLDACYNWQGCSPGAVARAVVLYRASGEVAKDDLHGVPPACPVLPDVQGGCDLSGYVPGWNGALFAPQGGLRISMRDLAKIGQMLARKGRGFLTPRSFAELTGREWRLADGNGVDEDGTPGGFFCAYGLALQQLGSGAPGCRDGLFPDGRPRIGHSGEAYGLRSGLWIDPATGRGLASFTTAVPDGSKGSRSAFSAEEEGLVDRAFAQRAVPLP